MLALPLVSARLKKLWIIGIKDLLDGDLFQNIFYFHIFSIFSAFKHHFTRSVDFTVSQLKTQLVMTSQIRSHIEYLTQPYYILVLML